MQVSRTRIVTAILAVCFLSVSGKLFGQAQEPGFTFYEEFQGSSSNLGQFTVFAPNVVYNANRYFGLGVGIPIFFIHPSQHSLTNWRTWNNQFGDPYVQLRFKVPNSFVNYNSNVTTYAPVADFKTGFTTKRVTIDWYNHLERTFGRVTPFVDASMGNTVIDRHFLVHPFSTLGFVGEFEGGASYRLYRSLRIGASLYDIQPSGTQKIFSRMYRPGLPPSTVQANHGRVFETAFETTGPEKLVRDNGYSAWITVGQPSQAVNFEVGYSRSVKYALDSLSFRIGVNAGRIGKHF
jgi:hypothetical protein